MNETRAEGPPFATDSGMPEMPAEHALLGLLALSESGSGHGYDLARNFSPDEPLGKVIRLEPGMIYHHLKKLERLGWVVVIPKAPTSRPARRLFSLTPKGRAELQRWLAEPVAHTREIRLEFLVKLYFALIFDAALAVRLIDEQREMCDRIIDAIAERLPTGATDPGSADRAQWFGEMVLAMRQAQTRAALDWLNRVRRDAALLQRENP